MKEIHMTTLNQGALLELTEVLRTSDGGYVMRDAGLDAAAYGSRDAPVRPLVGATERTTEELRPTTR